MLDGPLETFSSLNQHKFMMDGRLREKGNPMAKKYVARDPRTGKPIRMDKAAAVDASTNRSADRGRRFIQATSCPLLRARCLNARFDGKTTH